VNIVSTVTKIMTDQNKASTMILLDAFSNALEEIAKYT